jgi:hypothetical protein
MELNYHIFYRFFDRMHIVKNLMYQAFLLFSQSDKIAIFSKNHMQNSLKSLSYQCFHDQHFILNQHRITKTLSNPLKSASN